MIYTVTLNPALDRTVEVDRLMPDDTVRLFSDTRYAAGKGVDVSRVIKALGGTSVALGFCGGYEGMELEGRLFNDGIISELTPIGGETRVNLQIKVRDSNTRYLIAAKGPTIKPVELGHFVHGFRSMSNPGYVIISGSIPQGIDPGIYGQLIISARQKGALTALDSDGEAFKHGLGSVPDFIKPNHHELGRLVGRNLTTEQEILDAARAIQEKGVRYVIVSMGGRGMIVVTPDAAIKGLPPKVKTDSTVGAGDSALAGFIYAHSQGRDIDECTRLACAAGTATATSPGTALCTRQMVEKILPHVEISQL